MPSPTSSSSTTDIALAYSQNVNALISGTKWGGAAGSGTTLSYSFPWASGGNATFSGHGGGTYSTLGEQNATYHYTLNSTQQAAVRTALQAWANVANVGFQEVSDTSSTVGDLRFAWTSASDLTSTGEQAWGWGYMPSYYWPSGGDVWISTLSSGATNTDWSVGSYNFYSLIHETGHALGLKHPFEAPVTLPSALDNELYSVMSYTDPPNDLFRTITYTATGISLRTAHVPPQTPMVLDIATMQALYGANTTYHTGDDVYSFDKDTPFFKTIWDAGGNDTISVSNFSESCRIDLTPGNYSTIRILSAPIPAGYIVTGGTTPTYDGTNNLGIAYGATIENASGGSGNDTLLGNSANNSLDGGAGLDRAYYSGNRSGFTVTSSGGNFIVQDNSGGNGTDTLVNLERLYFSDKSVALDISGNAGQTYRLYQAAFDRQPDPGGLSYWINSMDGGNTLQQVAGGFIGSAEFRTLYGANPSTDQFITKLYNNVLHRTPEQAGYDWWVNAVASGSWTREAALVGFSESVENQANLIGVIGNGIDYTPLA